MAIWYFFGGEQKITHEANFFARQSREANFFFQKSPYKAQFFYKLLVNNKHFLANSSAPTRKYQMAAPLDYVCYKVLIDLALP